MIALSWPRVGTAQVAWAHVLVWWFTATYVALPIEATWVRESAAPTPRDWPPSMRTSIVAVTLSLAPPVLLNLPLGRSILFGILGATFTFALIHFRADPVWIPLAPEIELAVPVAYVVISALFVGDAAGLRLELIQLPTPNRHLAALLIASAGLFWLLRGGTHFVRAVLANAAVNIPDAPTSARHGRLIGNMERFLLAGLIGIGAYQAVGFLIAAKGLIRSKELEQHAFAEYFLIGTLASTVPAMVVGWLLTQLFVRLW